MDASLFTKMLSDKSVIDLKKMGYKYPDANICEFVELLKNGLYKTLPLQDFAGNKLVYLETVAQVHMAAAKVLLTPQNSSEIFGVRAMEQEIISTLTIENIDFSRDSVRKILSGMAPTDDGEMRVYGIKRGLEFISDPSHKITEENIFKLYMLSIGEFLPADDRLLPGNYYRHDTVYIVGNEVEHIGLPWQKLPEYMATLVDFIQAFDMNDLLKAALIHFYIAYLHPYFDGNGRMARLLHLWYLVQQGYSSALFIPLSEYIGNSRKGYYDAYTLAERNATISGLMDATPFLVYFINNVYHKLGNALPAPKTTAAFEEILQSGKVTEKEKALWYFVLSTYGGGEFSTKQLEKDYGDVAYATVRGFVLKFEVFGLLHGQKYSNKVKYHVAKGNIL